MFKRLKDILFYVLSALKPKMAASRWVSQVLPVTPFEHIDSYCMRLVAVRKVEKFGYLKNWEVTGVRVFKSKKGARHEYLSIVVVDHQRQNFTCIALERGMGKPDENQDPESKCPSSSVSSLVSSLSESISMPHIANDRIVPLQPSGKVDETDDLVYQGDFKKRLFLYELVILALEVRSAYQSYRVGSSNCYHFAGSIVKVLEHVYDGTNTLHGTDAGKWCGLTIYSGGDPIDPLYNNFRKALEEFVSSH
jgi:hypothetical protein